jgi:hypothetical protein
VDVAERPTYTAKTCNRGNWWLVSVPEVPGAITPVGRLVDAERMAREVIARVLAVPRDSFDVMVKHSFTESHRARRRKR